MKTIRFCQVGLVLSVLLVSIFLSSCLKIVKLSQPDHTQAGEIITTTLVTNLSVEVGPSLVISPYIGVHLPDRWTVISPVLYQGGYTGSLVYDASLATEMEALIPNHNYKWWVGYGDEHNSTTPGLTATTVISIQTQPQAGLYYLDYMTGDSYDGLIYDLQENIPITVTAAYGAGWQSRQPLVQAVFGTTSLTLPIALVDLGQMAPDRFKLESSPPAGWQASFWSENALITTTGSMTLYQALPLILQLNLPSNTALGSHFIPITATSLSQPEAKASIWVEVSILSGQKGYFLTANKNIWVIDPVTWEIIEPVDIPTNGAKPNAIALSPNGEQLYITLSDPNDSLLIFDTTTHTPISSPLPLGYEAGLTTFNCDGKIALVLGQTLDIMAFVDTRTLNVIKYLYLPSVAKGVKTSSCKTHLALITGADDSVTVIDTKLMKVRKTITGFSDPIDIVIAPNDKRAYVANSDNTTLGIIDLTTQALLENVDLGNDTMSQLAMAPDGHSLYVGDMGRLLVTSPSPFYINLLKGSTSVSDIEVSPDGQWIFVTYDHAWGALSIIEAKGYNVIKTVPFKESIISLALYSPPCCKLVYLPLLQKNRDNK